MSATSSMNGAGHQSLIEAWKAQSDLMWKTAYATPTLAFAILAGWYFTNKDGDVLISQAILWAGIFIMVVHWMVIHRMALYLNAIRQSIGDGLPHVPNVILSNSMKLYMPSGYALACAMPVITIILFVVLSIVAVLAR